MKKTVVSADILFELAECGIADLIGNCPQRKLRRLRASGRLSAGPGGWRSKLVHGWRLGAAWKLSCWWRCRMVYRRRRLWLMSGKLENSRRGLCRASRCKIRRYTRIDRAEIWLRAVGDRAGRVANRLHN
jgi:hypothetical protein